MTMKMEKRKTKGQVQALHEVSNFYDEENDRRGKTLRKR